MARHSGHIQNTHSACVGLGPRQGKERCSTIRLSVLRALLSVYLSVRSSAKWHACLSNCVFHVCLGIILSELCLCLSVQPNVRLSRLSDNIPADGAEGIKKCFLCVCLSVGLSETL